MTKSIPAALAIALFAAFPASAQTTAELLQKGIYAQETEGNLDNAILIYRQIVNSAPAQRDLAAQAQYRLAQALLQKGDLATASKEFERLARDYSDQSNLVSSLAAQMRPAPGGRGGRGGTPNITTGDPAFQAAAARILELQTKLAELRTKETEGHPDVRALEAQIDQRKAELLKATVLAQSQASSPQLWHADPGKPVTVQGKVSKVQWLNPRVIVDVPVTNPDGSTTLWGFQLGAPNSLLKLGWTRVTLKPGDTVTFMGYLAKEDTGAADVKMAVPNSVTLPDGRTLPNAPAEE